MASLQDQLLKMGVVSKQKAQQAKTEKRKQQKQQKNQPKDGEQLKSELEQERLAKQAKDRELNQQQAQEKQRRAAEAEVRQLIEQHQQNIPKEAEIAYNFVHGTKVKRLYVTPALQDQLARGQLQIVVADKGYRLVSAAIAERIAERLPERAIANQRQEEDNHAEDPYADFVVPDDLMW
ncbi:DUF2058 domain-containing protein [Balneatrix alpica]|uniref:DUF2058 domain-containing protein n=1 Tax=Balneatrix alpica TaxID=75684 RepID=A0ABV5ZFR0_9GAMM|nr:DUF2058 domain-containing protein [Balneatrix alpica]